MTPDQRILNVPAFLSLKECQAILDIRDVTPVSTYVDQIEYWKGRQRFPEWGSDQLSRFDEARKLSEDFYGVELESEAVQCSDWPTGYKMPPHFDKGTHHEFPKRDYAAVFYLNDDYEGGAVYFPTLNTSIRPSAGQLLVFHGGYLKHGVETITSGTRHTLITWYTTKGKYDVR